MSEGIFRIRMDFDEKIRVERIFYLVLCFQYLVYNQIS